MANDSERLARAGNYVLGMMNAAERERAEQDLMTDANFRNAVVQVAERMHMFDVPDASKGDDAWAAVAARLAELPQMRMAGSLAELRPASPAMAKAGASRYVGQPLHALGGARGLIIAAALVTMFGLGYAAGYFSAQAPAAVEQPQ